MAEKVSETVRVEKCHLCGKTPQHPGGTYEQDVLLHCESDPLFETGGCRFNGFYQLEHWNKFWTRIRESIISESSILS